MTGTLRRTPFGVRAGGQGLPNRRSSFAIEPMQRCNSFQLFSWVVRNLTIFLLTVVEPPQLWRALAARLCKAPREPLAPRRSQCRCVIHAHLRLVRSPRMKKCDKRVVNARSAARVNALDSR